MEHEEDFVNEELVEFEIDGKKFAYKPTTAGEENDWMDEYMEIDEKGKPKQNLKKINECKIRNLKKVPYGLEIIQKYVGVEKEWEELDKSQKWKLLSKLKPATMDKIILKMNEIDTPKEKKN